MIKNFIVVTFRNLFRNKVYVVINVIGLGLALALCIVAYHNHRFATEFDRNHKNIEEIYKINVIKELAGSDVPHGITPLSLSMAMEEDFIDFDQISRFSNGTESIKFKDNVFNVSLGFGDDDYFKIFTFPLISGDIADFQDPSKIFFTESTAIKFFGEEDPVGKVVELRNFEGKNFEFTVGGVLQNIPLNTSMRYEAITNFKNFKNLEAIEDEYDWKRFVAATFVRLKDPAKMNHFSEQLEKYIPIQNKSREDWKIKSFYLEPLTTMGFNGRDMYAYWLWESMHPAAIVAPSVMALLILLIACFNFTNTSIAFSNQRLKEIGIRKVLGGRRSQLILQFLGENLILCFLGLLMGLVIASFLVPGYSAMWEYLDLEMNFRENYPLYGFLVGLLFFTGLVAGIYPALYVSGFQPIKILNNSLKVKGTGLFSRILLTAQFSISIIALVSGIVFLQNARFQETLDLGYDKKNVIIVPVKNTEEFVGFKNEVATHSKILSITGTSSHIAWSYYTRSIKDESNNRLEASMMDVGVDYIETMNMHLIAGRNFDVDRREVDEKESVIISEFAANQLHWDDPVNRKLILNDTVQLNVIGVIKNFYLQDFFSPLKPTVFRLAKEDQTGLILARVAPGDLIAVSNYFKSTWKTLFPYSPYRGFFQSDMSAEARTVNDNIVYIFIFLSVLAVILSGIGLFTLVSMQILSKTKELGIRKVLGASIAHLMGLINRQFVIILSIASFIGAIVGYYLTEMLMASIFAVYFKMDFVSLFVPVFFTFVFAIFTIIGKVFKATKRNPVESLRYE